MAKIPKKLSAEEKQAIVANREKQTKEQYAAIGEFLVEFGQLFFWHRLTFNMWLSQKGMLNHRIGQIILGNRVVTPEPLIQITESVIGELIKEDETGKAIFAHIKGRYRALNTIRNDIVHGVMFVGWGNEETVDYSEFSAFKLNPTKDGLEHKDLPKTTEELKELIEEIGKIKALLHHFFSCLILKDVEPKMGEFSKNFSQNEKGTWEPHRPISEENDP